MHDPRGFEARLAAAYERWASEMPTEVDALAIARATRTRPTRASLMPTMARPLAAVLVIGLLLLLVVSTVLLMGDRPRSSATYEGVFTELGTVGLAVGGIESFERPTGRHSAVALSDGRVLVVGGHRDDTGELIFDPTTGAFSETGSMSPVLDGAIATALDDGRVIVVGGIDMAGSRLPSAQLYDPATGGFSETGPSEIVAVAASRLPDGRALILGDAAAEVYDPAAGAFQALGAMTRPADRRSATLLDDGRVLVVSSGSGRPAAWAETFDPISRTFSATGDPIGPTPDVESAILLDDGRVLLVGGYEPAAGCPPGRAIATAEVFDPKTGTFSSAGAMATPRFGAATTRLADGRILVTGGLLSPRSKCGATPEPLASAEVYDPSNDRFVPTGSMAVARAGHAAVASEDGGVLVVGGGSDLVAELYH